MTHVPETPGVPRRATSTQSAPTGSSNGSIDLPTLLITAAASAVAAYITSKVWAPGTLASAAFTPVIVAVLKEAFRKPTEVVVRPVRGVTRRTQREEMPQDADRFEQGAPVPAPPPVPGAPAGAVQYHRSTGRRWRLALITGLLGFLIAALVFTIPEIVAGGSASGGGRSTTLFGGDRERNRDRTETTTTTIRERTVTIPPAETVTAPAPRTVTAPPPETVTVPPPTTTTTTAPPAEGAPAPTPPQP